MRRPYWGFIRLLSSLFRQLTVIYLVVLAGLMLGRHGLAIPALFSGMGRHFLYICL